MYERRQVPPALIRLAAAQSGVISRSQAHRVGVPDNVVDRLIQQRMWGRLEQGLYLVPDAEPTWLTRVWAGLLVGGTNARAGGPTAGALQGISDLRELPVEIFVPGGTRFTARDWVLFRQERTGMRSISTRTDPPCTRIEDTVLDLCAAGPAEACVDWVTKAVQRRLTTPAALSRALQRRSRIPHRKLITGLIADAAAGVHSSLEHSYLRGVERAHSLPEGKRQRTRPGGAGFVDVLYPEFALVVELDGRVGHVGEGKFRDHRRDNHHTSSGLRSLRYGWFDVTQQPCAVALEVAEVLIGLGWTGYPGKCPRCPGRGPGQP